MSATVPRNDQEWHRFFTLSLDLLCIARFDGYFIHLNPAWERTLGFTVEELTAKPFIEFVHPEDREATIAEATRLMAGAETVSFQNRYLCKDGTYKWLLWSVAVSVEEQLYYSVARDITERKGAEDQLRESEERTRLIIDSAYDAFVGIDTSGLITAWNPQAEAIFGWPRADAIGRPLAETIIPGKNREAHLRGLQRFLTTGEGPVLNKRIELTALHRDGGEFPVELTISPLHHGGSNHFYAFVRDITDRKRAETAILQAKDAAERANRAKSEFLSWMSHELRTPLNAVIGFADLMLERSVGEITPKQDEYLRDIRDSGKHLLILINDILDIAKIEAGRIELQFEDIDLPEVIQAALTTLSPLIQQKQLEVSTIVESAVNVVRADKTRLTQILFNLLSNAVKFTPKDGRIRIEGHQVGDEVELAVVDTGPGIAPEDQRKLFQEFTQLHIGQQSSFAGTGLGLALVRHIVELHGGRVWVESEVGKGSRFTVRLPLRTTLTASSTRSASSTRPASVLIVTDDSMFQRVLAQYLTEAGYETESTDLSRGLVDKVKALQPSVICLDIRLLQVADLEVLRCLKEDPVTTSIPTVVTTLVDEAPHAVILGTARFLLKPVDREALLDAVGRAVQPMPGVVHKVLIVDDDPHVSAVLRPLLEQAGYVTLTASGGREGIALAQQHLPHLIIVDLMMPDVDGFQVIKALRSDFRTRGLPMLVLTAKDLTQQERAFLAQQVQHVVMKDPTAAKTVVEAIDRVWMAGRGAA